MSQQIWATNSLGGYLSNNVLSKQLRNASQPMMKFRQFTKMEPAAGKSRGDKVLYNKISNIATAGGTLAETDTIPRSNFTIIQGSLQIVEYGNAVGHTQKVDTLAEVSVPDSIKTVLRNDQAKVLDSAAAVQFQTSDYKCTITNTATTTFGSAGVATATAGGNMSDKNVRDIIDQMKKLLIPTVDGENYVCIASTNSIRGLYDFFEAKAINTTMDNAYRGEVGRYYKCQLN